MTQVMFRLLAFLKRKPGMSREAFRAYYENNHAKLVAELAPRPRAYVRHYLQPDGESTDAADELNFDVVTELEFGDRAAYEEWRTALARPEASSRLAADMANFAEMTSFRVSIVESDP